MKSTSKSDCSFFITKHFECGTLGDSIGKLDAYILVRLCIADDTRINVGLSQQSVAQFHLVAIAIDEIVINILGRI